MSPHNVWHQVVIVVLQELQCLSNLLHVDIIILLSFVVLHLLVSVIATYMYFLGLFSFTTTTLIFTVVIVVCSLKSILCMSTSFILIGSFASDFRTYLCPHHNVRPDDLLLLKRTTMSINDLICQCIEHKRLQISISSYSCVSSLIVWFLGDVLKLKQNNNNNNKEMTNKLLSIIHYFRTPIF